MKRWYDGNELEKEWIENLKNFLSHEAVCEIYTHSFYFSRDINVESRGVITKESVIRNLFLFSEINVRLLFIKRLVRLEIFKFRDNPRNESKVSRLKDYINSSKIFLINPIFLRRFSSKERSNRSAIVNLCFPFRPQIFNQFSSKDKCKWGRSCYYLNCHPWFMLVRKNKKKYLHILVIFFYFPRYTYSLHTPSSYFNSFILKNPVSMKMYACRVIYFSKIILFYV